MSNTSAPAKAPILPHEDWNNQFETLYHASITWVATHWLQIAIACGIGVGIAALLMWLRACGARLAGRDKHGTGWPVVLGRAIQRTNNYFIVLLTIRLVEGFAGAPHPVSATIHFLFTIVAVFQSAIWAREVILGAIEHRTHSEHYSGEALMSAMGLIRVLVSFALFAIAFIVVLDNLGVNVTGLIAGLGVGGIAIGLAAQGIFADLFAALAIIFDRPFRRGDAISYGQSSGTVEEIGLKSTRIRGTNGEERIISNRKLLDQEICNNTRRQFRRTTFTLGIAYDTPAETLQAFPDMVKEVVESCGLVFDRCGFLRFNASTLDFDIEFDSDTPDFADAFDGRHKVGIALIKMCAEKGISIPFPTHTISNPTAGNHIPPPPPATPAGDSPHA